MVAVTAQRRQSGRTGWNSKLNQNFHHPATILCLSFCSDHTQTNGTSARLIQPSHSDTPSRSRHKNGRKREPTAHFTYLPTISVSRLTSFLPNDRQTEESRNSLPLSLLLSHSLNEWMDEEAISTHLNVERDYTVSPQSSIPYTNPAGAPLPPVCEE
mmetsp:Transcript_10374/g.20096  ORF Transcript_10374/g.20096 Transcript_10374/m.20096 type:complete len:157 (-) Transcript_10374:207-677(-)